MSDSASDLESIRAETKSTVDPVKSFLSGGFGGIACVLVGHPFDLTYVSLGRPTSTSAAEGAQLTIRKVRMQTASPGQYSGAIDVVRKTIAADGIKG